MAFLHYDSQDDSILLYALSLCKKEYSLFLILARMQFFCEQKLTYEELNTSLDRLIAGEMVALDGDRFVLTKRGDKITNKYEYKKPLKMIKPMTKKLSKKSYNQDLLQNKTYFSKEEYDDAFKRATEFFELRVLNRNIAYFN